MDSKSMTTTHAEDVTASHPSSQQGLLEFGIQLDSQERDMTLLEAVKHHKRILFFCIGGIFAGALTGYDNIANSATLSMPAFLIYFGEVDPVTKSLYIPSIWTALWTSMGSLVQAIASFAVAFAYDRYGRKWTAVSAGLLSVVGVAVQVTALSRGTLLGGKLINGFAQGALAATAQTYVSEIAPVRIRGPVQSGLALFSVLMLMIGLGIISIWVGDLSERAFRLVFGLQFVWAVVVVVIYPFLPESPVYLLNNNKVDAARASLAKLYGKDNHIDARLAHLRSVIQHENNSEVSETGSYIDCFKGSDRRRTLTAMFTLACGNICGAAFLGQSIYFLFVLGMDPVNVFNITIGGFGLAAVFIIASWVFIERFGRRSIFLAGSSVSVVGFAIVGALYYVPGKGPLWGIAIMLTLLTSWQLLCLNSVSFPIVAEMSSLRLRGKTLALCYIFNTLCAWLTSFVVPYMYNVDSGNLGARTAFVWGGISLLYFAVSFFAVPETVAITASEMDWLFENKVPSRKFQERRQEATAAQQINLKSEMV